MNFDDYGDIQAVFGGHEFDPMAVEPSSSFDPLPPGDYPVLIEQAEIRETKKGDGSYLKLTLQVLDGQFKGRKLWDNINLANPNVQCVEIGMKALASLGRALGGQKIRATEQLLNQVVAAKVAVKNDKNYGDQNVVREYKAPSEAQPQTGDAGLPAPAQPAPVPVAAPQAAGPAPLPAGSAAPGVEAYGTHAGPGAPSQPATVPVQARTAPAGLPPWETARRAA